MNLVYRNKAGGQPWANRLAEGANLVYVLQLRDRCRSGLSGSPGKRVLGKTNRGFESLPVRPYYVPQPRDFEGLGGQGVSPPRGEKWLGLGVTGDQSLPVRTLVRTGCLTSWRGRTDGAGAGPRGALQVREAHNSINPEGCQQRFRGDRESIPTAINIWIIGLGRAVYPQPASSNIYTPKRSARRRRDTPPYLIFNFPKQTRRALRSVGPSCGERGNPMRPLPVIFCGDDSLEVEW